MEHDEPPSNVLPLFPGIDTAPFGTPDRGSEPSAPENAGWAPTPEQHTMAEDTLAEQTFGGGPADTTHAREPTEQPDTTYRRRSSGRVLKATSWIAAAVIAGVAINAGHAAITTVTQNRPPAAHSRSQPSYARALARALALSTLSLSMITGRSDRLSPRTRRRESTSTQAARKHTSPPTAALASTTPHRNSRASTAYSSTPQTFAVSSQDTSASAPITVAPDTASSASQNSHPASANSQPAFGANGTLGPGTSPNS